jgi:hypothetical protein
VRTIRFCVSKSRMGTSPAASWAQAHWPGRPRGTPIWTPAPGRPGRNRPARGGQHPLEGQDARDAPIGAHTDEHLLAWLGKLVPRRSAWSGSPRQRSMSLHRGWLISPAKSPVFDEIARCRTPSCWTRGFKVRYCHMQGEGGGS